MVYEDKECYYIVQNAEFPESIVRVNKQTLERKVLELFDPRFTEDECDKINRSMYCDDCPHYNHCLLQQYKYVCDVAYYEVGDFAEDLKEQGKLTQDWLDIFELAGYDNAYIMEE